MPYKIRPAKIPSLRRALIKIHRDLFEIDGITQFSNNEYELNNAEIAILILEDRRFFNHRGFDLLSIIRELWKFATSPKYGGASTIDMQLVRTATGYRNRTIRRKLYEIMLSILIQFRYDKYQILRSYTENAFFGSHLYGIESASLTIYGVMPNNLTVYEASTIAAMLVYPRPSIPSSSWEAKIKRRALYAVSLFPKYEERYKKIPRRSFFE